MQFSPTRFNRHLANLGQDFVWSRAFACACASTGSGGADPRCPHCLGKGYIWNPGEEAKAAAAGQKTQAIWAAMGLYAAGDVVLTVPGNSPMWHAGKYDRIDMRNNTDRFSMRLKRGAPTERLLFTPAVLERVFWFHPQTRAVVEGGLPTVSANGVLTWGDDGPPPGADYSLTGQKYLDYFIFQDLPRSRNMHYGKPLPKNVVLRRFDLLNR